MKKIIAIICIAVLSISALALSGCTALKATNQAKEMLAEYFEYYNDGDIDECIDMFGDEIIDDLSGDDATEIIMSSRRMLLGEVEEFEITSFDSDGSLGDATVSLEVETTYENQDDAEEEEYVFFLEDGEMYIGGIGVDFEASAPVNELIENYFEGYDDMDNIEDYYIPYYMDNFFVEEDMAYWADSARRAGGDYKEHEITDYYSYYDELDWDDDIYHLSQLEAELEFENEDFYLYAEVSSEDNKCGFNFVEYYPLDVHNILEGYYTAAEQKNTGKMMDIYLENFFDAEEFSADDWETGICAALVNDYGAFVNYTVYSWEPTTVDYNGQQYEVYSVVVASEFEAATFEEDFVFIIGEGSHAVIGHQIY